MGRKLTKTSVLKISEESLAMLREMKQRGIGKYMDGIADTAIKLFYVTVTPIKPQGELVESDQQSESNGVNS